MRCGSGLPSRSHSRPYSGESRVCCPCCSDRGSTFEKEWECDEGREKRSRALHIENRLYMRRSDTEASLAFCETRPSEGVSCSPLSRRLLVRDRVGILLWTRRCVMERRGLTPRLKLKQLEKKLREQDISRRTFLITVRVVELRYE